MKTEGYELYIYFEQRYSYAKHLPEKNSSRQTEAYREELRQDRASQEAAGKKMEGSVEAALPLLSFSRHTGGKNSGCRLSDCTDSYNRGMDIPVSAAGENDE
jgi:hypothetical protein